MKRFFIYSMMLFSFYTGHAQTDSLKDKGIIFAIRALSNIAIIKHDVEGITKYLTPDVTYVIGRAKSFEGKDAVIALWKQLFAANPQVGYVRRPSEVIISKNDTLAWETGTWEAENSYSAGGNYSAMWCKRNGIWMTRAELFVSLEK